VLEAELRPNNLEASCVEPAVLFLGRQEQRGTPVAEGFGGATSLTNTEDNSQAMRSIGCDQFECQAGILTAPYRLEAAPTPEIKDFTGQR
jgi:hypothetical protein